MNYKIFILILFAFGGNLFSNTNAFSDSTKKITDSHPPKRAAAYSAILPGLGQAYNQKYWKIPIIYAGIAGLGYVVKFNNDNYQKFKDAYIVRVDGDPLTIDEYENKYTEGNLNTLQEYYHRNRDLSIIGCAAFYVLNIIDATVDAHLFKFDVSDDLSMTLRPESFIAYNNYTPALGFSIKLNFN